MSYDLRVWEQPVGQPYPGIFEEAIQSCFKLEELKLGPNSKFIALAEQMAARESYGNAAWIGDPVADAKGCIKGVWAFEVPVEDRVHLLRFVVERANALGLTVFDDQLGLAFMPPDRVLPPERSGIWERAMQEMNSAPLQDAVPRAWTLASARRKMQSCLAALLVSRGFIAVEKPPKFSYYSGEVNATYFRATEAGGQSVTLLSQNIGNSPRITVDINIFSEAIADILRAIFPEKDEMYVRRQLNFFVGVFNGASIYDPVRSEADVQGILGIVEEHALPVLETTRTSLGMEAVMGGSVVFPLTSFGNPRNPRTLAAYAQQNYGYAALISAWLHGSEPFSLIEQRKREHDEYRAPPAMTKIVAQNLDHVLVYLREHVKRSS